MTDFAKAPTRGGRTQIGYLIAGIVFGALWLSHSSEPLWEVVLRLVVIMGIAMTVSALVRRWAVRRGRRVPEHSIGRFVIAKLALLMLAVIAAVVLELWIPKADMWIGLGMAVLVAVVGPRIHPWLSGDTHHTNAAASA